MKAKSIPQFEFGFKSEPFALVGEKAQAVKSEAPTILAEMSAEERERVRAQSKAFAAELAREIQAEPSEVETTPGLAPGSYWSGPMAKALATMQRSKP